MQICFQICTGLTKPFEIKSGLELCFMGHRFWLKNNIGKTSQDYDFLNVWFFPSVRFFGSKTWKVQKYAVRENCHIGGCKQQLCLSCLKKQVVFSTKIKLPRQPPKKVIKNNDRIFGTIGGWRRNPLLIYISSFPFLFSLFSLFSRPGPPQKKIKSVSLRR